MTSRRLRRFLIAVPFLAVARAAWGWYWGDFLGSTAATALAKLSPGLRFGDRESGTSRPADGRLQLLLAGQDRSRRRPDPRRAGRRREGQAVRDRGACLRDARSFRSQHTVYWSGSKFRDFKAGEPISTDVPEGVC